MSLSLGKLKLDGKSHVMGILNVTPDSFYDGGWHFDNANSQRRIEKMIAQGATTKPGTKSLKYLSLF